MAEADQEPVSLDMNEVYERVTPQFWKASEQNENLDQRFSVDPERLYFRYEHKPLTTTLPLYTLAALFFFGQLLLPHQLLRSSIGDLTGFLRMAMILLGSFLVFVAWPRYRDVRVSPEEEAQTEELRERIRQRRRWP